MTINERLGEFMMKVGVSQSDLSRILNISRSTVSGWFNEKKEEVPARKILKIIAVYKDLNARWLITGEGEMLEGSNAPQIVSTNEVRESKPAYGSDLLTMFREVVEENGVLKERNRYLVEEISQLKGDPGRGRTSQKARAG